MAPSLGIALALFLVTVLSAVADVGPSSTGVTIVDLGFLPPRPAYSVAYGINNAGQIVGESSERAFLYDGTMTELLDLRDRETSTARAINDLGQVVGYRRPPFSFSDRGFIWRDGTMTDLPLIRANDVNEHGHVVGGTNPSPSSRALLWDNGTTTDLGLSGGQAFGINNLRQVVGSYRACCYFVHGFLWESGASTDLGSGAAMSINDASQVVSGGSLWENGTVTSLGTLGGTSTVAFKINNPGQVVGASTTASGAWHAFLWEDGAMADLGTLSGGSESAAYGINDHGQVWGTA